MISGKFLGRLLAASALCAVSGHAFAQTATDSTDVGEIVVTATKQETAVSKVPISVAVVTRDNLDQQSIRNPEDLSRITPSLTISNGNNPTGSGVTIRGLSSPVGAPTVGIYLDDINITRRNALGAVTGSGTTFPQLFDIERVEVLRGPQGTLYGGNSIGGTIKFVLPEPSLTQVRLRGKVEGAVTKEGDPSIEGGVSAAFPIVQDKLGVAVSAYARHIGGYIDHVSRFDGKMLDDDSNYQNSLSGRIAFLYRPNEKLSIKPSVYASYDRYNDQDQYWTNVGPVSVNAFRLNAAANTGIPGLLTNNPYLHPAYTTPAYNVFGPYRTGNNCNVGEDFKNTVTECVVLSPRASTLILPSLTIDYDAGFFNLKSITSYTYDKSKGNTNNSFDDLNLFISTGVGGLAGAPFLPDLPMYRDVFTFSNERLGWTQEFRVATPTDKRLSVIAGAYYSLFRTDSLGVQNNPELKDLIFALGRETLADYYGPNTTSPFNFYRQQYLREQEKAVFGEATLKVTEKLRLIGGVRLAQVGFSYYEAQTGTTVRRINATLGAGLTEGSIKEKPVSPKAAVQYFINDRNMVYASATKGFRPGGVTSRPPGFACDTELATLGIGGGLAAVPFKSDSVWSYEAGAKVRPFGNLVSIDGSVYHIDWKDTQVNYRLLCGGAYVANAGSAKSTGVDLAVQVNPTSRLSLSGTFAYVDARYDRLAVTANNVTTVFINQDDRQPVPKFTMSLGAQYKFPISDKIGAYVRGDYQYASSYPRSPGPGTNGFFPDVYYGEATSFASARVGFELARADVSLFVNNIFNSQDVLTQNPNGGRGGCQNPSPGVYTSCTRNTPYIKETTFRPRTIGVTTRFRY